MLVKRHGRDAVADMDLMLHLPTPSLLTDVHCLQIKGTKPIQIGTYATVIGGLIGVGALAYLGLKL